MEQQVNQQPETTVSEVLNIPEAVSVSGQDYEIKRFSVGQLMQAAKHIAPLGYLIEFAQQANVVSLLVEGLSQAGEPAVGLMSVAIDKPAQWFDDKDPVECYELLAAIVEKNVRYFFDSGNKARIDAATARIKAAIPTSGGVSSTASSEADTAH